MGKGIFRQPFCPVDGHNGFDQVIPKAQDFGKHFNGRIPGCFCHVITVAVCKQAAVKENPHSPCMHPAHAGIITTRCHGLIGAVTVKPLTGSIFKPLDFRRGHGNIVAPGPAPQLPDPGCRGAEQLVEPGTSLERNRLLINTVLTSSAVEGINISANKMLESEKHQIGSINLLGPVEKIFSQPS